MNALFNNVIIDDFIRFPTEEIFFLHIFLAFLSSLLCIKDNERIYFAEEMLL